MNGRVILASTQAGGQDARYLVTFAVTVWDKAKARTERRYRVKVHVDTSYPYQGSGKAEVWSPSTMTWNEVAFLPGEALTTKPSMVSAGRRVFGKAEDFAGDVRTLALAAQDVVDGIVDTNFSLYEGEPR